MPVIPVDRLHDLAVRIFTAVGTPPDLAQDLCHSLIDSNLAGHDSHGAIRIPSYVNNVRNGVVLPAERPRIVRDDGPIAVVDGRWGWGQITARVAVDLAIRKCKQDHIAAVAAINCNHIGRLGEWTERAIREGVIAMVTSAGTGVPAAAPHGGARRALGTNPISFGIPGGERGPVLLDYATTALAQGKLRVAQDARAPLPENAILDKEGRPSTNVEDYYAGGMLLPVGEHKGYALSMVVQMLSVVLTGADEHPRPNGTTSGSLYVAIDPAAFRPREGYQKAADALWDQIKAVPPREGFDEVLIPGEPEARSRARRLREGISLADATWDAILSTASRLGVPA